MDPRNVIVGKRWNSSDVELISGPEIPIAEQENKFMPFRMNRANADYEWAALCRLDVERLERFSKPQQSQAKPKEGKSQMKSIKSILSLIAFAALMFIAPVAQAQSYNQINSGFAATFNIAGASTNTTVSATNGAKIYATKATHISIQPSFKLTEAGTSTVVLKFDESVDDSNWKIASRSISVAANGTNTVATVLNITDAPGFLRLSQIENPNTGALTNVVLKYSYKTP